MDPQVKLKTKKSNKQMLRKELSSFMRSRKGILLGVLLSVTSIAMAQSVNDTNGLRVLGEQDFLNIIRAYHPVIKLAGYSVQRANFLITEARGGFDPVLSGDFDRKRFDGSLYYSYYNPQLKIPTWYGIEIYAGTEEVNGGRVNNESTIGQTSYLGLSVPLLKDLLMDKRRAVLLQAKVFRKQARAEQAVLINDLLLEGIASYWNWVREYQTLKLLNDILAVNETRFRFIRIEYQQGNRPAIDTVEALAQLQNFKFLKTEAQLRFRNAALELSNYCWLENEVPYNLSGNIIPDSVWLNAIEKLSVPLLDSLLTTARVKHPKLQVFDYKIDWLRIEQKLKFQNVLPKLDVKTNLLNKGYNVFSKVSTSLLENNYKYGIHFSMPLRFSEGRGAYKQVKFKVAETTLGQKQEQWQIENKVKSYYNEVYALKEQVQLNEEMLTNYERLLRGEETRFSIGESTLFILNTRENRVLESLQKLIELKTKFYKSFAGLQWAAGLLR